jgi:hypothetical protein
MWQWFILFQAQVELLVNLNLKRCPFRWECSVSSPATHQSWFIFSFNSSLAPLADGPYRKLFACFSPIWTTFSGRNFFLFVRTQFYSIEDLNCDLEAAHPSKTLLTTSWNTKCKLSGPQWQIKEETYLVAAKTSNFKQHLHLCVPIPLLLLLISCPLLR